MISKQNMKPTLLEQRELKASILFCNTKENSVLNNNNFLSLFSVGLPDTVIIHVTYHSDNVHDTQMDGA
jgi:hypothetical protein